MKRYRQRHDIVTFNRVGPNHIVPMQPWPQTFYVSRSLMQMDAVEIRPLTVTGLVKGLGRNLVTINWWRLCWLLRGLGLLSTGEGACYRWSDLTFRFWRHHQLRRFRWVRRFDDWRRAVMRGDWIVSG